MKNSYSSKGVNFDGWSFKPVSIGWPINSLHCGDKWLHNPINWFASHTYIAVCAEARTHDHRSRVGRLNPWANKADLGQSPWRRARQTLQWQLVRLTYQAICTYYLKLFLRCNMAAYMLMFLKTAVHIILLLSQSNLGKFAKFSNWDFFRAKIQLFGKNG